MGILRITKHILNRRKGLALFLCLFSLSALAGVKESLVKKYPKCSISLENVFPKDEQIKVIKNKYPTRTVSNFYSFYKKDCAKRFSHLFVFSDIVRTQKQFLLFDVKNSKIENVELLKFLEPNEYKIGSSWLNELKKDVGIDGVSGATLTANSSKFLAWLALYLNGIIKNNEST